MNSLSGTISAAVGFATNLTQLHLGYNNLNGTISGNLSETVKLTFLCDLLWRSSLPSSDYYRVRDLSNNEFSGTIPSLLPTTLTILNLASNNLSGTINKLVPLIALTDLCPYPFICSHEILLPHLTRFSLAICTRTN